MMVEPRLDVLSEPSRSAETVTEVCRRYGISRDTNYGYRRVIWRRAWTAWRTNPDASRRLQRRPPLT